MDYKETLKKLKDAGDWEELLTRSLSLFEDGNEDRFVIRMIVQAYEELDREEEALPFWEVLAREEHHAEEFSKKLIEHHRQKGNRDAWLAWSQKLIHQALRKKEYDLIEDIWIQLVEANTLEDAFAVDVSERLNAQEQTSRAFTLLDIFLLSLEDDPERALSVAKRMLAMEPDNMELRKRVEGFYRKCYESSKEVEQFLEKANIRKSDDVHYAMERFERLMEFCPGNYISHRSWGIGKVRSVDLLFGKMVIDFPANPGHSIDLEKAFTMLEPLNRNHFAVRKIEDPASLKRLKRENPAALIALVLEHNIELPQKSIKALLEGIVGDDEWTGFLDRVKKEAKSAGLKLTRKGSSYLFSLGDGKEETALTLSTIAAMKNKTKRIKMLLRMAKEEVEPSDIPGWTHLADPLLADLEVPAKERIPLLLARKELTKDVSHFADCLETLSRGLTTEEKRMLVEGVSKKKDRKVLLDEIASSDVEFARTIFLKTGDDWLRRHALQILERKGNTQNLVIEPLRNPYKFPLCFLYVTEMSMKESERPEAIEKPIIVFEVLLELMVQDEVDHKVRSRAKTVFSKLGFDLYRWMLETGSKEEIMVLLDMIKKHALIESSEKITFEKLAESRHPSLKEKHKETFFYATKEAIQQKQKELDHLVKVEVPENSAEIGRAARQGDLSENFDYIAAKEKQRKLIDRVSMLKKELSQVQPIESVVFSEGEASVGTRITVQSRETGKKRNITILGPWDAVPEQNIISHTAPLAQEIIGKKVGDTFYDSFHSENLEILTIAKYTSQT